MFGKYNDKVDKELRKVWKEHFSYDEPINIDINVLLKYYSNTLSPLVFSNLHLSWYNSESFYNNILLLLVGFNPLFLMDTFPKSFVPILGGGS